MKTDLIEVLAAHTKWLRGETGGRRADLFGAKLSGAEDLSGANLSRANFSRANFSGVNFSGANLSRANFSSANFSGVNFSRADLTLTNFSYANLSHADLANADLVNACLTGACLTGAYLMPGLTWERYLSDVVPALCTAGGKTLEDVAAGWDCHDWTNCPMHIAFDAPSFYDVPLLYQREAELFITLFDAKLIPNPLGKEMK